MLLNELPDDILLCVLDQTPSPVDRVCLRHSCSRFLQLPYYNTATSHYFLRGDYGLTSPQAARDLLKQFGFEMFPATVAEGFQHRADYITRCFPAKEENVREGQKLALAFELKKEFLDRIDLIRRLNWDEENALASAFVKAAPKVVKIADIPKLIARHRSKWWQWGGIQRLLYKFKSIWWNIGRKVGERIQKVKQARERERRQREEGRARERAKTECLKRRGWKLVKRRRS